MSILDGYEADRLYAMERAVKEWKEARRALLSYPFKKDPDAEQLALWRRLSEAEYRLMQT